MHLTLLKSFLLTLVILNYMANLKFETLTFADIGDYVEATFLKLFAFRLEHQALDKLGKWKITGSNELSFAGASQESAEKKFNHLLAAGFDNLYNRMSKKKAVYIHRNSGIPLIGSIFIGLMDKNVSTIEVKPVTSCNTDCIFCSVDLTRRFTDFVVEKDYLVEEFRKLVEFKQSDYIEANINPHGEPTIYGDLVPLVRDLSKVPNVKSITMNTNATLLTRKLMDDLIDAGMTRFNVSIHSLNPEKGKMLFNTKIYDVNRVKESCRYLASRGKLLMAPVWVPGTNDEDMDELIEFAKEINAPIRMQNYQVHAKGKKVKGAKEKEWDVYFKELQEMENKHGVQLIGSFPGFVLKQTKKLSMPFSMDQVVNAKIICSGEFKGDVLAVAENRCISIPRSPRQSGNVKVRITRAKYNTFFGEIV